MPTPADFGPEPAALTLHSDGARGGGDWTVRHMASLERALDSLTWPDGRIRLDMSGVRRLDIGGAWVLQRLSLRLEEASRELEITGLSAEAAGLLDLVRRSGMGLDKLSQPVRPGFVEQLGRRAAVGGREGLGLLAFVGEMGAIALRQVFRPARVRWREIVGSLADAGPRALAIVGLLSFLLGIVIAYQGGVQLRLYGASLFVADLVGLSMVRELAPLITAIIVAGRTRLGLYSADRHHAGDGGDRCPAQHGARIPSSCSCCPRSWHWS